MAVFPNPHGQPIKLDDAERRKKLLDYLRIGLSRAKSLRRVGIKDHHTLRSYLETHPEFAEELDNAEIDGEVWHLKNWHDCAKGVYQTTDPTTGAIKVRAIKNSRTRLSATIEFLARKYPDDWARKTKHEITGKGGGAIQVDSAFDLNKLTLDELRQLRELRQKMEKRPDDEGDDGDGGAPAPAVPA